jgi:hypothetical protein
MDMRAFFHWARGVRDRAADERDPEAIAVEAGSDAAAADTVAVASSQDDDFIGEWD